MFHKNVIEENISNVNDDKTVLERVYKRRRLTNNSDSKCSSLEDSDSDFLSSGPDDEELDGNDGDDVDTKVQLTSEEWKCERITRLSFSFLVKPGLTFLGPEQKDCLFYMEKFIDDDFIRLIVEQTNKYAQRFYENNTSWKPQLENHEWIDTNENEMRVFIYLLVLQGIIQKPSYDLYFTEQESLKTPFFYKTMSEERFKLLVKFLHFNDNSAFDSKVCNRKTYKIDPILDYLRNKFKMLYIPEKEISVNKCHLFWREEPFLNEYIPTNKNQYGVRWYTLCESESGYIWNFILHTKHDMRFGSERKLGSQVVFELCHDLLYKGYTIYLDNWCTDINLVEKLCQKNTDVVGVLGKNRKGIPYNITSQDLKNDEHIARFKDKIMVMKWKRRRDVIILSTVHDNNFVETTKSGKTTRTPQVVIDYKKCMGRIDLTDNQIKIYQMAGSQIKKYYYKIFLHLLNLVCLNSYILYKKDGGHLDMLNFLTESIENGVKRYRNSTQSSTTSRGVPSLTLEPSRLIERHFADYISSKSSRPNVTRRCKLCYSKGLRKETRFWCPNCNIALCMPHCFKEYHTAT